MSIFQTQGVRNILKAACLVMGLVLGTPWTLAQDAANPADVGVAMEQVLAKLAGQREAQARETAEQALAAADRIVNQPALEGFGRALQRHVAVYAALLRQQLASGRADEKTLTTATSELNDAIAEYRVVASFPPMRVVKATPGTFTLSTDTQPQWAAGLLVNVQADEDGLVLVDDQVVELQGPGEFIETSLLTRNLPEDDQVTISCWFFPTSLEREMAIIEGNTAGKFERWQVTFRPQQQVALRNEGPQSAYAHSPVGTVPLGRWTHVAMTFGRGEEILPALYVNGLLVARQNEHRDYPLRSKRDKPLRFGSDYVRFPQSHFMLRQARIWRGIRSATQIQDDMFEPLAGDEPNLIGHWPLDEGQGTNVRDGSPSANHGTLHGGRWSPRAQQGYRLANPVAIDALSTIQSSRVSWIGEPGDENVGTVIIHAGVSVSPDTLPRQWHQLENGRQMSVPGLSPPTQGTHLWLKQTLNRPDRHGRTPRLRNLQLEIIGR